MANTNAKEHAKKFVNLAVVQNLITINAFVISGIPVKTVQLIAAVIFTQHAKMDLENVTNAWTIHSPKANIVTNV